MAKAVADALAVARAKMIAVDTPTAALDARLLLQAVLKTDHAGIIAGMERELTADELKQFDCYVARRVAHEPVSKILGQRDFYGRSFHVTADVLDPRADTETIVELALQQKLPEAARVLDLGSGSGALICTLLAEWPTAEGVAVDLSAAALEVTRLNAKALGVAERLQLFQGSWFAPVDGLFDLIVSNPPYIPSAEIAGLEPDVRDHDPHSALDGGSDGLDCYRAIAGGAGPYLRPRSVVLVEVGAGQADEVVGIFTHAGFRLAGKRADLGGHVRALGFDKMSGALPVRG